MKCVFTILLAGFFMLPAAVSAAETPGQLKVSATVPPRACHFPDQCKPVPRQLKTMVKVSNRDVHYIGSPPDISEKDGRLIIAF
jgi:hypothetical protein